MKCDIFLLISSLDALPFSATINCNVQYKAFMLASFWAFVVVSFFCDGTSCHQGLPRNFFRGWGGGSIDSVEDRGQRERGSGDVAP